MSDDQNQSPPKATILVTGGCGYIGSHTLVCLLEQGYNVVVVDNLVNSSAASLDRVATICGLSEEDRKDRLIFYQADLCDKDALRKVFEVSPAFQSCIHFAGLKVRYFAWVLWMLWMMDPLWIHRLDHTGLILYLILYLTRLLEKVPRFH